MRLHTRFSSGLRDRTRGPRIGPGVPAVARPQRVRLVLLAELLEHIARNGRPVWPPPVVPYRQYLLVDPAQDLTGNRIGLPLSPVRLGLRLGRNRSHAVGLPDGRVHQQQTVPDQLL